MNWHDTSVLSSKLAGTHSFLSPSSPAWLNYEMDKLDAVYYAAQKARLGTEYHELAYRLIKLRTKLPETNATLNMYVNDAIGWRLTPEQLLFYSENCYGHADTCGFRDNVFRVSDLKMGVNEVNFQQLKIYAALFCLEYGFKPFDITIELRIYQNDRVKLMIPDADDIMHVIDKIITFDKRLKYHRAEASS